MINPLLAEKELELLKDLDFLTQKRIISNKLIQSLENLAQELKPLVDSDNRIAEEVKRVPFKISKGENYKGLPYFVLDYPRYYTAENIFAFRTMVWWGKQISFFLHLKGDYLPTDCKPSKANNELYVAQSPDPWEHEKSDLNFIQITDLQRNHSLPRPHLDYLKIGSFADIDQINNLVLDSCKIFSVCLNSVNGK